MIPCLLTLSLPFVATSFRSVLFWWFRQEVGHLTLPRLTLGGVRREAELNDGEEREDGWRYRGSQGCTVNTGRKMPKYHRQNVDVCSFFFLFCCSAAHWNEPTGTLESKVKNRADMLVKLLRASTSCVLKRRSSADTRSRKVQSVSS